MLELYIGGYGLAHPAAEVDASEHFSMAFTRLCKPCIVSLAPYAKRAQRLHRVSISLGKVLPHSSWRHCLLLSVLTIAVQVEVFNKTWGFKTLSQVRFGQLRF